MAYRGIYAIIRPVFAYLQQRPGTADFEEMGRRSLLTVFLLVLTPPLWLFGIHHIRVGHYAYGFVDILLPVVFFFLVRSVHQYRQRLYIYRLTALVLFAVLVFWFYTGPFQGYASIWAIVYPLIIFFLLGRKEGAIWSTALILAALLIFVDPLGLPGAYPYSSEFAIRCLGTLLIVFLITYYYEFVREKYKENFEAQQAELERHQRDLEKSVAERTAQLRQKSRQQARLIDEQKKVEEALRQSEEKYRTILENIEEGYYEVDIAGNYTFFNPPVCSIQRQSPERLLGMNCRQYTHGQDRDKLYRIFNRVFTTGQPARPFSQKIIRADGTTCYVEISASLKRDARGRAIGFRGIIRDVTSRYRDEQRLRRTQKMEALGTLTGGVAHDFNNILSIIMGYTELLESEIPKDTQARKGLEMIYAASLRARDVVRHLLTFSRKGEESHAAHEIGLIIKEALKMMRSTIPATVEIRDQIQTGLPLVVADPTQIHQVMVNLCKNAADAMEESGGILKVGLAHVVLKKTDMSSDSGLLPGNYVRLTVSDTGQGIAAKDLERIFDPYFTTKEVDKGTGLGLSVVMGIVKSHRGSVRVKSRLGEGTEFEVYFPLAEHVAVYRDMEAAPAQAPAGGTGRILFVDDETAITDLNHTRLESLGYRAESCNDPLKALSAFRRHPEAYDLIITDMTMPQMTGVRLAHEMLQIRPETKIILCTGYSEKISEQTALANGFAAYLEKPVGLTTLAETIRAVMEGKT